MENQEYDLIIFDLDWTLVQPIIGTGKGGVFRKGAEDWQFIPGVLERIKELKAKGKKIAIATNQGGVAFGLYGAWPHGEAAMSAEVHRAGHEIGADYVAVCFNHPSERADLHYRRDDLDRKPGPGMLLKAIKACKVEASRTLMVGDGEADRLAAEVAGCAFKLSREFFDAR